MIDSRGERTRLLADALREAVRIPGPTAVHILGHHSGTVYLNEGSVTGAECSGTPDLRTRLIRSGLADDHAGPSGTGSPKILREDLRKRMIDGSVHIDDVEALALSVILDAVQHLAHPAGAAPPRLRVQRGQESTHGIDTHVPLDTVLAVTAERTLRARRLVAGPDAALVLRHLTGPGVVVDTGRWQILARINGRLTPRDLAWATGAELFATLLTVDGLARDGLCRVAAAATPTVVAQRRAGTPTLRLLPAVLAAPAEWADDLLADPPIDADLIQRLVTGLRALG